MKFQYYRGQDSEQFTFFRIPKQLFSDPTFKHVSAEAKILYGLLLDRMSLSKKSGWADEEDRVYIVFPLEEIQEQLDCCREKAIKLLNELEEVKGIGLIERVRRGLGQPSIIYVKDFTSGAEEEEKSPETPNPSLMSEKPTSRRRKNRHQDIGKTDIRTSEKPTSRCRKNRH